MSEWWTYSLSDFLLFSPRTYYRLFELYNLAVWPWHLLAIVLGLAVLLLWFRGGAWQGRAVAIILATCWLFVAWAYLLARYDTINWAASYFAAGFAVEALLLVWTGLIRNWLSLRPGRDIAGAAGLCIFVFALIASPLVGRLLGRPWLQAEIFGIARILPWWQRSAFSLRPIARIGNFSSFRCSGAQSAVRRCGPCNRRTPCWRRPLRCWRSF
jgi:Family of unknown function (DUF6064)